MVPVEVRLPLILVLPVIVNVLPSNVKLASAFAVLVVPREVNTLLSTGLVIVLKPVPDVPLEPVEPDEPVDPDEPLEPVDPEEPVEPEEPLVPEEPGAPV